MADPVYGDTWVSNFITQIFFDNGLDLEELPDSMTPIYELTNKTLQDEISAAFARRLTLQDVVTKNIFRFSGAKTYQEAVILNTMLYDSKGVKVGFSKFKKGAKEILDVFNVDYLKTEARTARAGAAQIVQWQDIKEEKEIFPLLRYVTVGDKRVRPGHRILHDTVRRTDDPFWQSYYPPNGFNCRCFVEQLGDAAETEVDTSFLNKANEDIPKEWRFNVGEENQVFSDKHPYLEVPSKDKDLKKRNFNFKME